MYVFNLTFPTTEQFPLTQTLIYGTTGSYTPLTKLHLKWYMGCISKLQANFPHPFQSFSSGFETTCVFELIVAPASPLLFRHMNFSFHPGDFLVYHPYVMPNNMSYLSFNSELKDLHSHKRNVSSILCFKLKAMYNIVSISGLNEFSSIFFFKYSIRKEPQTSLLRITFKGRLRVSNEQSQRSPVTYAGLPQIKFSLSTLLFKNVKQRIFFWGGWGLYLGNHLDLNLIKWKCSLNDNIVVPGLVFKHNQEATCRVKWDRPGLDFQIRSGSSSVFEAWLYVSLLPAMFGLLLMLRFTRWRKFCASFHGLSMLPIGTNLTFTWKFKFSCVCGWVGLWEVQKLSYVGL